MGGDEARVALVCGASNTSRGSNPAEIQREIAEAWDAKGRMRVFGAEDLSNLPQRLRDWIMTTARVGEGT